MNANIDVAYLELTEVSELIRTRQVSSREVTQEILDRIDRLDPTLNSYAHVMTETALRAAQQADHEIARGHYRGPLHGVPIGLKDLIYTTDAPTAGGGVVKAGFVAPHDATVVSRLRAAGAVLTGKVRLTEGAHAGHHPTLPTPVNPWDAETWSGVSSSGSGVATAAGLCYGALGTDTGGSIRLPSSANGLTGLKPTWSRVSRYGVMELAASLDHIGPMARSAKDCAAILGVIAGNDVNDPTSSLLPVPDYIGGIRLQTTPRLGVDYELIATFDEPTIAMIEHVIEVVKDLGWYIIEIRTPDLAQIARDYEKLCGIECANYHRETYPSRASEYGPELTQMIEIGRSQSAVEMQELLERRRAFTGRLKRMFEQIDLLLVPGCGYASPTLAEMEKVGVDSEMLLQLVLPTAPFDFAGVPAVTLPGGFTDRGTPLGFQFVGRDFEEQLVLQAGNAFQSVTDFHRRHPLL